MEHFQSNINAIVSGLHQAGLEDAVLSPGSRNAPLIMSFCRLNGMRCHSVLDERSAGFIALGIAKTKRKPVAVVCTSGSALANIYPAVLEAWYMQIPLIVVSADRPAELIDRWDGQAIHQKNFFAGHIKASFHFEEKRTEDLREFNFKEAYQAARLAQSPNQGPIHFNVPLSEPLYHGKDSDFDYPVFELKSETKPELEVPQMKVDFKSSRVMVLLGASDIDLNLNIPGSMRSGLLVLPDLISNSRKVGNCDNWESVLLKTPEAELPAMMPDVLITAGKMVLNKTLRNFLRIHKPSMHIHVEEGDFISDPFFTEPLHLRIKAESLDEQFFGAFDPDPSYPALWEAKSKLLAEQNEAFLYEEFNEFLACRMILENMRAGQVLHLANSMTIRNAAYNAGHLNKGVKVFSNRGVSGIDGCSGTAIGSALSSTEEHILITGDLAFLYDINSWMLQTLPPNLKVFVINNSGGGIFNMIDGPSGMNELNPYVISPHHVNIGRLCEAHGLTHYQLNKAEELKSFLENKLNNSGPLIVELITDIETNTKVFKKYKEKIS